MASSSQINCSSMAAPPVFHSLIVNEPLDEQNYEEWSVRVRTYLVSKSLWSVVEKDIEPRKKGTDQHEVWEKLNAEALHVIHLCCGTDAFKIIKSKMSAYEAWKVLTKQYHPDPSSAITKEDPIPSYAADTEYENFVQALVDWDWRVVKKFIKKHPDAIRIFHPYHKLGGEFYGGQTVLYFPMRAVRLDIVKELLWYMKTDDIKIIWEGGAAAAAASDASDRIRDWGKVLDDALDQCCILMPDEIETVEITKCFLQKKKELRCATSIYRILTEACKHGRSELACYLYKEYRDHDTLGIDQTKAADIISLSLRNKKLDIAWDLIQQEPSWGITKDSHGRFPLKEFSRTPSLFFSGSKLKFWQKWTYYAIPIPMDKKGKATPQSQSERSPTMDNKGNAVAISVEDGEGNPTPALHADSVREPTSQVDKDKPNCLIRSACLKRCWQHGWIGNAITALFEGLTTENICKVLGIHRCYQMKLNHHRSHEILLCMCKALTPGKMEDWDVKQFEIVIAALFSAAERGFVEFLTEIWKVNPGLAVVTNEEEQNIFQVAVKCRQAEVFNLIHGFDKDMIERLMNRPDKKKNNMLHTMGFLSPLAQTHRIRGVVLQMQNELQWFKELESMVRPELIEEANDDNITPRDFFSKNHEEMVKGGETLWKETAKSCTTVCALIITMMFAAAFTIPGGINEDDGIPKLLDKRVVHVFITADAISLFTSTTSAMLFLGVLTSRYVEKDFLTTIPRIMILGHLTLFISVIAMMIAFSSTLYLMLSPNSGIYLPIILLTGIPIASFLWMQFPFLLEIFVSTYMPTFHKNEAMRPYFKRIKFYYQD